MDSLVVAKYRQKVGMLCGIGLPEAPNADLMKEWGWWTDYNIVLRFVPRYTDEEYIKMTNDLHVAKDRIKMAKRMCAKEKYVAIGMLDMKFPVPKYYDSEYSIYVNRTDEEAAIVVVPSSFAEERDSVLKLLDEHYKRYPEPSLQETE